MPLFEYRCSDCQEQFEELVSYSESKDVDCPHCGGHNTEKLVSAFAIIGGSSSGGSDNACGSGGGFT